MGKIINLLFIMGGIGLFILIIDYFSPIKLRSLITDTSTPGQGVCSKLVNVNDSSMQPVLKAGSTVVFNRCIEGYKNDLEEDTIVLVEKLFSERMILVVRDKNEIAGEVIYSASSLEKPKDLKEVKAKDIVAIYEPPER